MSATAPQTGHSLHEWSYRGDTGPLHWGGLCRTGTRQSPISIDVRREVKYDASLNTSPLTLGGYEDDPAVDTWEMINNGHTVKVNLPKGYSLSGGPLSGTYKAAQFHFHWGSSNDRGSEHTLNGRQYPLEIHIVHHAAQYSLHDAKETPDGLAVIGILVDVGVDDNKELQSIFDALPCVSKGRSRSPMKPFVLQHLIPDMSDPVYFTYPGSLTTPGCFETVTWIVMEKPLMISDKQMAEFRVLQSCSGDPLDDNFRSVQPLNGRVVRSNRPPQTTDNNDLADLTQTTTKQ